MWVHNHKRIYKNEHRQAVCYRALPKGQKSSVRGPHAGAVFPFSLFRLSGDFSFVSDKKGTPQGKNSSYSCAPGAAATCNRQVALAPRNCFLQQLKISVHSVTPNLIHIYFIPLLSWFGTTGEKASERWRTRRGVRPHLRLTAFPAEEPVHFLQTTKTNVCRTKPISFTCRRNVFKCMYAVYSYLENPDAQQCLQHKQRESHEVHYLKAKVLVSHERYQWYETHGNGCHRCYSLIAPCTPVSRTCHMKSIHKIMPMVQVPAVTWRSR